MGPIWEKKYKTEAGNLQGKPYPILCKKTARPKPSGSYRLEIFLDLELVVHTDSHSVELNVAFQIVVEQVGIRVVNQRTLAEVGIKIF